MKSFALFNQTHRTAQHAWRDAVRGKSASIDAQIPSNVMSLGYCPESNLTCAHSGGGIG